MSERQKDIGALWLNKSKAGNDYLSGNIEIDGTKHKIVIFANSYKEQEKHPDYKIYLSTPRGEVSPHSSEEDSIPF